MWLQPCFVLQASDLISSMLNFVFHDGSTYKLYDLTFQWCMFKSSSSVNAAINALCGIGILSTPYALKEGGWFSILILFTLGTITCYTGILLKRCLESSPHLQTYPDIGQAAFGLRGRICIAVSISKHWVVCFVNGDDYLAANKLNLDNCRPSCMWNYMYVNF